MRICANGVRNTAEMFRPYLTTELVAKRGQLVGQTLARVVVERGDAMAEVGRRLKDVMGLKKTQAGEFIRHELAILRRRGDAGIPKDVKLWANEGIFDPTMCGRFAFPNNPLPKPEELTASELVLVVDDANAAFYRAHERLTDAQFRVVCNVMYKNGKKDGGSPYYAALMRRFSFLGVSGKQASIMCAGDGGLIGEVKWGKEVPDWTTLAKYKV